MSFRDAGELLPGRDVVQLFRATDDELAFISPKVATYQRQNSGKLTVSLHRASEPPEAAGPGRFGRWWGSRAAPAGQPVRAPAYPVLGEMLAETTFACDELSDNEAIDFPTTPATIARGDLLALRISGESTWSGVAPTVWLADDGERLPGHVACYIAGRYQGAFGVRASTFEGGLVAKSSVPREVCYSPITQCNLNCIHCISRETRSAKHRVSDEIKAQLQEWCRAGLVDYVSTDYSGDILWADHRFGGELDFLFGLGVRFHIDTSGTHLFPEVSERLCRSRLARINISLDAAEDASYRRVRKGAPPLAQVIENVAALVRARAATGATFMISTSFTLMRSTLREWPDFVRMSARLGVDLTFARHLEAYTADMEAESLWNDQEGFNKARLEALAVAEELGIVLAVGLPFSGKPRSGRKACPVPWTSTTIIGNGDVLACCIPGLRMGNLYENSMQEIWNGPAYRRLRATVNSDTPPPTCAACPFFGYNDNPDTHLIHSALRRIKGQGAELEPARLLDSAIR